MSNRIVWTEYLTQLSHRIPPGMKFVSILGEYELKTGSERTKEGEEGPDHGLSAMVPRQCRRREVDKLLNQIREAPAIQRDFPD